MPFGQSNGIFAFSTPQFQGNGILVVEKILMPVSFQRKSVLQFLISWLKEMGKGAIFSKTDQLLFGHNSTVSSEIRFEDPGSWDAVGLHIVQSFMSLLMRIEYP